MALSFSAIYKDGRKLTLSDNLGYEQLPRENLFLFEVQKDNEPYFLLRLDDGQKLIYRRRTEREVGSEDNYVVHLVGWRKGSEQSINYISEDGKIIQAGKFDEEDAWMYSPKLREFEI